MYIKDLIHLTVRINNKYINYISKVQVSLKTLATYACLAMYILIFNDQFSVASGHVGLVLLCLDLIFDEHCPDYRMKILQERFKPVPVDYHCMLYSQCYIGSHLSGGTIIYHIRTNIGGSNIWRLVKICI